MRVLRLGRFLAVLLSMLAVSGYPPRAVAAVDLDPVASAAYSYDGSAPAYSSMTAVGGGPSAQAVWHVDTGAGFIYDSFAYLVATNTTCSGCIEIGAPGEFNPSTLEGMALEDVRASIPEDWAPAPSTSGGGEVFRDPGNPGRQIRIMPGYPAGSRPDLITTGPYAVVSQNGVVVKVPLAGNPVLP